MELELLERGGALLIDKAPGISSFGVVDSLVKAVRTASGRKRKECPSFGHGGTLDPFATGLLVVCVGRGVKLARYFLGSRKAYEATVRFGESSASGDLTDPVIERSGNIPEDLEVLKALARGMTEKPYLQTPPMHSAKKRDGVPLYELARQGIEIEREPSIHTLYSFDVSELASPRARIAVECSSGTYIRVLAQDWAKLSGSIALLESLRRTRSGSFSIQDAQSLDEILATEPARWPALQAWVPFDRLIEGFGEHFARASASEAEVQQLVRGQQEALGSILSRSGEPASDLLAIYWNDQGDERLAAVARRENLLWKLERVFA